MNGYHPALQGEVGQVSSPASQFPLTFINSPWEFLLESGRQDTNLIQLSWTLR